MSVTRGDRHSRNSRTCLPNWSVVGYLLLFKRRENYRFFSLKIYSFFLFQGVINVLSVASRPRGAQITMDSWIVLQQRASQMMLGSSAVSGDTSLKKSPELNDWEFLPSSSLFFSFCCAAVKGRSERKRKKNYFNFQRIEWQNVPCRPPFRM